MIVTGTYSSTCPHCRAIIDYGCLCEEPQPRDDWRGFDTVAEAKADVDAMRATTAPSAPHPGTQPGLPGEVKQSPANQEQGQSE